MLSDIRTAWPGELQAAQMGDLAAEVAEAIEAMDAATAFIIDQASAKPEAVQAVAVHYLLMWGCVLSSWLLTGGAAADSERHPRARFAILHRLVRVHMHLRVILRGAPAVLA